jgi:hypothetical protein
MNFCVEERDYDPVAWLGGSWYCAHCGREHSDNGEWELQCQCGKILLRNGGSR